MQETKMNLGERQFQNNRKQCLADVKQCGLSLTGADSSGEPLLKSRREKVIPQHSPSQH